MGITLREAAEILDPVMTCGQVRTLVALAGIEPCGRRRTGRAGRPADEYNEPVIRRAHAEEADRTLKQFTDNDWIASALLARKLIRADVKAGYLWWPDGTRAETLHPNTYGFVRIVYENVPAHRVVWIAADGEIPPAMQVNHRNKLRWDNRRENLELVSFGNNVRHAHGKPYLTYHQAIHELSLLPPPLPENTVLPPALFAHAAGGKWRGRPRTGN
jgi:hypothetical protein